MFSESTFGGEPETLDGIVQTDIAQFQIDEIMLRLYKLQVERRFSMDQSQTTHERGEFQTESVRPPLVEKGMETSICEDSLRQLTVSFLIQKRRK